MYLRPYSVQCTMYLRTYSVQCAMYIIVLQTLTSERCSLIKKCISVSATVSTESQNLIAEAHVTNPIAEFVTNFLSNFYLLY